MEQVNLSKLLVESDFIGVRVLLTRETHYVIAQKQLEIAKDGSFVVNTARGAGIDETTLCEAVRNGRIAGAYCWNTGYCPSRRVITCL